MLSPLRRIDAVEIRRATAELLKIQNGSAVDASCSLREATMKSLWSHRGDALQLLLHYSSFDFFLFVLQSYVLLSFSSV